MKRTLTANIKLVALPSTTVFAINAEHKRNKTILPISIERVEIESIGIYSTGIEYYLKDWGDSVPESQVFLTLNEASLRFKQMLLSYNILNVKQPK